MNQSARTPARRHRAALVVAVVLALTGGMFTASAAPAADESSRIGLGGAGKRPNIILVTTDDQRLDDMRYMRRTRRLVGGHGYTFGRALSPHPLCCPARAEILTGQYAQNNGVQHNKGRHGGLKALRRPSNTLARWLQKAGYRTAMAGKYLHGFNRRSKRPAGWTHWNASVKGHYTYDHTYFAHDGRPRLHRKHVDDVIMGMGRSWVRKFSKGRRPFFLWLSGLAPHRKLANGRTAFPRPAARHRRMFPRAKNPARRKPSFGRVSRHNRLSRIWAPRQTRKTQRLFKARIRSLQAIDQGVARLVRTLRRTGELRNTYIVFTSDNGNMLGEHRLGGKNNIFEEALRVPLLIRTPKAQRRRSALPVTSVDLPATILGLARASAGRKPDGDSFLATLRGRRQAWRDTQLIQTGTDDTRSGWDLRGVRTTRWTYARKARSGRELLFDRRADPHEVRNLVRVRRYRPVLRELRQRTRTLRHCAGNRCSRRFGPVPGPR